MVCRDIDGMHGVSAPRSRVPYTLGGFSEGTVAGMQGRLGTVESTVQNVSSSGELVETL